MHLLALSNLVDFVVNSWIGPAFVLIIAAVAIVLALKRQLAAFLSFAAIAVLAAIFIFFGNDLFGKNGNVTKASKSVAQKINTIDLAGSTYAPGFLRLTPSV